MRESGCARIKRGFSRFRVLSSQRLTESARCRGFCQVKDRGARRKDLLCARFRAIIAGFPRNDATGMKISTAGCRRVRSPGGSKDFGSVFHGGNEGAFSLVGFGGASCFTRLRRRLIAFEPREFGNLVDLFPAKVYFVDQARNAFFGARG